jgi:hypothetical protein
MKAKASTSAVSDLFDAWTALLEQGAQTTIEFLRALKPSSAGALSFPSLGELSAKQSHGCSCHIPPACWLPVDAGDVATSACAAATATMQIKVTNCGIAPREVVFEAQGTPAGLSIAPAALTLGPLDNGTAVVTFALPAGAQDGQQFDFRIWVRACKLHYVNWTVTAGEGDCGCTTVSIEDCPDTIHHWYDHFYCKHPCMG